MNLFQNKILRSALGGALGGLIGWMLSEPMMFSSNGADWGVLALFGALNGAALGVALGSAEGLSLRSIGIALRGVLIGGVIGFFGGAIGSITAQLVYAPLTTLCGLARGAAWSVFGFFLGLSEGVRRFSLKGTRNAAIGGILGGFIGGVLFDFVATATGSIGGGSVSRAVGLIVLGACIGILIALVERILTEASLLVAQGRQEGRTILLDKPRTTLGRDERNDVYLSDGGIQPRHAEIRAEGGGYAIASTGGAISVNQTPTTHRALQSGDQIDIGGARLVYRTRKQDTRTPSTPYTPQTSQPPRIEPRAYTPPSAAQVICPRCAHANRSGAKFCQRCRQRL